MAVSFMLEVMRECRNFFEFSLEEGEFSLSGGEIGLRGAFIEATREYRPYRVGEYLLLTGSAGVDGLYAISGADDGVYTLEGVNADEEWEGAVWALRIPRPFVALCAEIEAFHQGAGRPTAYTSEMVVGLHQWTRSLSKSGAPIGWREVYSKSLAPYRRMFTMVRG